MSSSKKTMDTQEVKDILKEEPGVLYSEEELEEELEVDDLAVDVGMPPMFARDFWRIRTTYYDGEKHYYVEKSDDKVFFALMGAFGLLGFLIVVWVEYGGVV